MPDHLKYFIEVYTKFFFLLTPFFVLSMFLTYTAEYSSEARRILARKVTIAVLLTCYFIILFGGIFFSVFGITLDAFRIGAGSLLFLSAVNLVQGAKTDSATQTNQEIAVVPLAIPITVGPATIGALIVMSAENHDSVRMIFSCVGLAAAVFTVGFILIMSSRIKKILGESGIIILSKITGVILSAIAAQMVFSGIKNFLA